MRILVTSFEPFGDDIENASAGAMAALLRRWAHPGVELVGVELPVVFDDAPLRAAVARHRPDAILCLGEAGRRTAITPERRGVNEMTASIPDNAGHQPQGERIVDDGPRQRGATVDIDAITDAIRAAGWAASTSDDAGQYVCNFVAFHAHSLGLPAVFIHVPALRTRGEASVGAETGGDPDVEDGRMPRTVDDLGEALAAAVRVLACV